MPIDPNLIDEQAVGEAADASLQFLEGLEQQEQAGETI